MTYTTDNRFCVGASRGMIDDALAAYGARWIDRGPGVAADVLPDRQGFAYNDEDDVSWLIGALNTVRSSETERGPENADVPTLLTDGRVKTYVRRCGGYIYVDAFLVNCEAS